MWLGKEWLSRLEGEKWHGNEKINKRKRWGDDRKMGVSTKERKDGKEKEEGRRRVKRHKDRMEWMREEDEERGREEESRRDEWCEEVGCIKREKWKREANRKRFVLLAYFIWILLIFILTDMNIFNLLIMQSKLSAAERPPPPPPSKFVIFQSVIL